jgi:rhodanese-related sulfurtransferase
MKKIIIIALVLILLIGGVAVASWNPSSNSLNSNEASAFIHLSSKQFNNAIKSGKYTLLDIRTKAEFDAGHLAGAKEIDYYQTQVFSDYLDSLDKTKKYLIYCHTGRRSGLALVIFKQKGFKEVYDLAGGHNAWIAAGFLDGK